MKTHRNYGRLTEALQTWSGFRVDARRRCFSWDSADVLIGSADALNRYAQDHLDEALAISNRELMPLTDPLNLNLGSHRWLSAEREESYSDWLAWILQGMSDGADILSLFSPRDRATRETVGIVESVRRESWSDHGRTDIEVSLGNRGFLLIEVKVRNTDTELSSQLERYAKKVADLHVEDPVLVLIGTETPEPSLKLFGFTFTGWDVLCRRLRQYANRVKESELLRSAAILIFCGAVEQNLLGLSAEPRHFRAMATVDYLREWGREKWTTADLTRKDSS